MIKKILKVVGIYAVVELAYCMGKGHMLAWAKYEFPKEGWEMWTELDRLMYRKDTPLYVRVCTKITLLTEDVLSEYIFND